MSITYRESSSFYLVIKFKTENLLELLYIVLKVTLSMRGSKKAGGRGVENSNVFTSHCKVTQLPRPKISTGKRSC